jgi:DNA polymerase III alpha subunit
VPQKLRPLLGKRETKESLSTKVFGADAQVVLPDMALSEQLIEDYRSLRLSLRAHPLRFLRDAYTRQSILSCQQLAPQKDGARVKVGGVVLVRQKPGSARGVCFITIEDESGWARTSSRLKVTCNAHNIPPSTSSTSSPPNSPTAAQTSHI